jgi:NAD(P)-dependent dehydrogenase (short-subunit alcohol dehydrogenase family)
VKYTNLFSLKGKAAVITGGAGLIGGELSRGLAESGAAVIVADKNKNKDKAFFKLTDITKERSISALIDFVDKKFGGIDVWINNAYPRTKDWGVKFEDILQASWKKNIDDHLGGYFLCCQKIAEYMKNKKRGSIINMASIYGIVGPDFSIYENTDMTMPAAYSAIKGGIITFTKYLASYYGKYNVRVNCVSPGGVYNDQPKAFVKKYVKKVPLNRMACSDDIVGAVVYLASDASKYVTGHNLVVDGGWSIV